MSFREDHNLEDRILQILFDEEYYRPEHHFGRPFLSAYQIAIEFTRRFPEVIQQFGHPIGSRDSGVNFSLASYIAGQLSQRIRSHQIDDMEGGFLSNRHLRNISFNHNAECITSSLTGTQYDLSLFRLRG